MPHIRIWNELWGDDFNPSARLVTESALIGGFSGLSHSMLLATIANTGSGPRPQFHQLMPAVLRKFGVSALAFAAMEACLLGASSILDDDDGGSFKPGGRDEPGGASGTPKGAKDGHTDEPENRCNMFVISN